MAKRAGFLAELLLPGGSVGQRQQVTRALVQLGQAGPRARLLDIVADVQEDPLQARLAVDCAVDVSVFGHESSPFTQAGGFERLWIARSRFSALAVRRG